VSFIKKAALTAASAAALESISFAGPAQADKADGPAGTIETRISFLHQIGITNHKITIGADVECDGDVPFGVDLHGKFRFTIVDVSASDTAGHEVDVYKKSIKAKRISICESGAILRVPQSKLKPAHQYAVYVFFDATKNHEEADSSTSEWEPIGIYT
jgi:hypothetical protein